MMNYLAKLTLLAAIWGASFIFMTTAGSEFGAFALIWLRSGLAALCLLPLVLLQGRLAELWRYKGSLALVGLLNAAFPFVLFTLALQHLTAGFTSIINALAPAFTALVAYFWFSQRLTLNQLLGMVIALGSITALVWQRLSFDEVQQWLGALFGVLATLSYGISANFSRHYCQHIPSLTLSMGSQFYSACMLAPLAWWFWPEHPPSLFAWSHALVLGVLCTGLAFLLFFNLIKTAGAVLATSVTFLIPLFAYGWGYAFLEQQVGWPTLMFSAFTLLGTGMANNAIRIIAKKSSI